MSGPDSADYDATPDWAVQFSCLRCEYVTAAWAVGSPSATDEMRQHVRDRHPHVLPPAVQEAHDD